MRPFASSTVLARCVFVTWASFQLAAETRAADEQPTTLSKMRVEEEAPTLTEGSDAYITDAATTATGLDLSLRDTPQSVSIVTRARMDDYGMTRVADALSHTTGVSLKAVDRGRNNLSVRGFDVTHFQFDGMPVATGNIGIEELNTVIYDRIEIVRGATGLVTGAGEPSAAINLVRKHANSNTFAGWVGAEWGSWNHRAATVDLSTPLSAAASVRARVVAQGYEQDAFIDLEHKRGTVFYGVVDADLSARTRLSVGASIQQDKRSGVLWYPLPLWYADGTRTHWDRSKTSATRWNEWDTTEQNTFATLEQQLSAHWTLRVDASFYRQVEESKLLWFDGYPNRITGVGMTTEPFHYLSKPKQQNFSVAISGPFTAFGHSHQLTVGIMHSRLRDGWTNRRAIGPLADVGDFNHWNGSYPEPALGERFLLSQGTTTQSAAYAAARLQLTTAFKLIAGGRLSRWQRDEAPVNTTPGYTIKHDHVFTPYAGLIYDLTRQVSAYASYTDIFNPQTARDRNGAFLDPLKGKSYEVGLKSEWLEGRLHAAAAVFRVDQDNLAVADEGRSIPGTHDPAFRPAQGTLSKGYELELAGELTRDWNMVLGWTHYSAKDASGAPVASHHPRKLLKLDTTYALRGAWQGLRVGGSLNWESQPPKIQLNPVKQPEATGQPAYALVDLMARYEFNPRWSAQLNVYNVFDKTYRTGSPWWNGFLYGEPRNAKLSVTHAL